MSEPIYVPALPARWSALTAYELLTPDVRTRVAPLWTVPPRVGGSRTLGTRPFHPLDPDPSALACHLRTALRRLVAVQSGLPAWVDTFHAEDEPWHLVTEFRHGLAGTPLRPVTGVERDVRQQTASAEAARASGNGLGVRVLLHALPDERMRDEVGGLLERIGFAHCPVDLLLDLGGVDNEHRPAEKWALRALGLLGPLHHWRTIAVLAGSFPRTFPEGYGAPLAEAQRFDWDLWHMLVDGPERPRARVTYGDYGADHTGGADRPGTAGGGSPWGVVRYTTDRTFLLGRVPTQGPDHADAIRALVREIVEAEDFRGAEFSEGERWLSSCAGGSGSAGAGTPAVWLRAGHVQHMAQVVRGLRRHSCPTVLARRNRLPGITLGSVAGTVLTNTGLDSFLDGAPEHRDPAFARAAEAVLGLLALRGADRATGVPEPTPGLVRQLLVEDLPTFVYAPPDELAAYPAVLGALAARFDGGRRERIAVVVAESAPDFERAMNDPGNLTWHRWYASLLRTVGADLADPEDVRRRLAALDGAPLPDGVRRAHLMGRTALADVLLAEALTRAYVRDAETPPPAGPLLTDHAVATGIGRLAGALLDRWTAAGLAEQLAGPYARFAPGPEAFPHLVLADALLDEHLDYYGDPAAPVPPPPAIEAGPVEEDADALIAAVEELAEEEFEPYGGEAPHLLYAVYQRGCSADSVARKAAEYEDWSVDPALEDLPVPVPDAAPDTYTTPPVPELVRLLGTAELNEADRARLEGPARDLAVVLDRLAATGLVFRAGDAFGLTPRGAGVVRYLLGVRGVAAPDAAEAVAWTAPDVIAAAGGWSTSVAARVLADWLHARADTADAWSQLLAALGTVHAGTAEAAATRGLFAVLDTAGAPPEALRGALRDPVIGAYALEALRKRGEPADPIQVRTSARALHVLDALPAKKGPLESRRAAFDTAAAAWPGGSAALVRAMAAADRHETERVLRPLGIALP